jgi:hypothetical protein
MKMYKLSVAALLVVLAASALAGCGQVPSLTGMDLGAGMAGLVDPASQPTGDPSEASTATLGSMSVVVCDISGSTRAPQTRRMYVAVIDYLKSRLGPGDRLVVMTVDAASVQNSCYLVDVRVPPFSFEASSQSPGDNVLQQRRFRSAEKSRYASEYAAYQKRLAPFIVEARGPVSADVAGVVLRTTTKGSDLAGALQLGGDLLSVAPQGADKRLITLSDGLLEGEPGIDWRLRTPTDGQTSALIERHRAQGRLADLHGARVCMIGARGRDAAHVAALGRAWARYVTSANGVLESRFFMGAPAAPLLEAFAGPVWEPAATPDGSAVVPARH